MLLFKGNHLRLSHALGHRVTVLLLAGLSGLTFASSALASEITVASPVGGTSAGASVWVRAHNIGCDGLPPLAFGYSIDDSPDLAIGVTPYDIDVTHQAIGAGTHTVHFKSWTSNGVCPVVDSTFVANGGNDSAGGVDTAGAGAVDSATTPSAATNSLPGNASISDNLDSADAWQYEHDGGTPGYSRGSTVFPATTPVYDDAREFYMTYSDHGGERWHLSLGNNPDATHFVLDTYVYFADPEQVQNLEMDFNQVLSDGNTIIFGTQCSSISKTWEFTAVSGGGPHWHPSNVGCNPQTWAPNTWHHVQLAFHRDGGGAVVHDWVNLDGTQSNFQNANGYSGLSLGWARGDLLVNFQLDGSNADGGSITAFVHKMTVASW